MKACWEAEKQRIVSEVNTMCGKDKEKAIEDTKKKQWVCLYVNQYLIN